MPRAVCGPWRGRLTFPPQPSCGSSHGNGQRRQPLPLLWPVRSSNGVPTVGSSLRAFGRLNEGDRMGEMNTASERRGFGSLRLRGRIWWARYKVHGKVYEESTGTSDRRKAEKLLDRRE